MTEANFASHVDSLVGGTADTFIVCAGPTAIVGKRTAAEVRSLLSVLTSAQIAAAYQPIGSYAAASHTHTTADITGFAEAVDDEVASLLVAGTNISLTYNDAANTLTIASTVTGTIGGSTGATDNRLLRSDGTGGATLQNSPVTIDDSGNVSGVGTLTASAALDLSPSNSSYAVRVANNGFYPLTPNLIDSGFPSTTADFAWRDVCLSRSLRFQGSGNVRLDASSTTLALRNLANSADANLTAAAITASGLMCAGVYTFATVPIASSNAGKFLRISDRAQKHAYSDGTNWRFFGDDAVIS